MTSNQGIPNDKELEERSRLLNAQLSFASKATQATEANYSDRFHNERGARPISSDDLGDKAAQVLTVLRQQQDESHLSR